MTLFDYTKYCMFLHNDDGDENNNNNNNNDNNGEYFYIRFMQYFYVSK